MVSINDVMEDTQESRKRNWESLLTELWIDILLELSIRDVVICRSISKFFQSIIDLPNFAVLHLSRHVDDPFPESGGYDDSKEHVSYQHDCGDPRHDCVQVTTTNIIVIDRPTDDGVVKGGLYVTKFGNILTPSIKFKLHGHWGPFQCDVIGTVNGLLLLHKYESRRKNWNSITELILWNPLTGKTSTIPKSPLCLKGDNSLVVTQPAKMDFVYDAVNDDYKIVVVVLSYVPQWPNNSIKPEYHATVEVYSLRSEGWRGKLFCLWGGLYLGPKINYGGSVIWLAGDLNPQGVGNDDRDLGLDHVDDHEEDVNFTHLVYYDLVNEELYGRKLPISDFVAFRHCLYKSLFLGVYKKSLAVFAIESKHCDTFVLWVLNDDEIWEMPYDCPVNNDLYSSLLGWRVSNAMLFVTDCSSDILVSLHGRGLIYYSAEDGFVLRSHPRADFMDAYVQTLLSPSNPFGSKKQLVFSE